MRPNDLPPTSVPEEEPSKTWKESVDELCCVFGISKGELFAILMRLPKHYRVQTKTKPSGKTRTFYTASKRLRKLQDQIKNWLDRLPISNSVHGWCKGRSPKTAAEIHVGKLCVINLDITDFFPFISNKRVYMLYTSLGCNPDVSRVLTMLTTYQGHLAQGLTTSPTLANLIMASVDDRIEKTARNFGFDYTRSGDDITFSGNTSPWKMVNVARTILLQSGYQINPKKFAERGIQFCTGRQTVVGVTVNQKPNVLKKTRRRWRAMIHNCWAYGPEAELREGETVDKLRARIGGYLSHMRHINPTAGQDLQRKFRETKWE